MTARTGATTYAEVLREGRSTLDGRLLVTGILEDFVGITINLEFTFLLSKIGTRLVVPVIYDVVFYERINRPAIDTDVVVTTGATTLFPVKVGIDWAKFFVRLVFVVLEADTATSLTWRL